MAISRITYTVTRTFFQEGILPKDAAVLEFGEANWYGDVPTETLLEDIRTLIEDPGERDRLSARLETAVAGETETRPFDIAKVYYDLFYGCREVTAIDLNGTDACLRHDLNHPLDLDTAFDVTINNGTAEHVFNYGQVFASMHQYTRPGGLMIHEGPLISGWVDHGFVNFQPTLFFDLARANNYDMWFFAGAANPFEIHQFPDRDAVLEFIKAGKLPENAMLLAIFRKNAEESEFRIPFQGYYSGGISDEARKSWRSMR